jgi:hypothetical protein
MPETKKIFKGVSKVPKNALQNALLLLFATYVFSKIFRKYMIVKEKEVASPRGFEPLLPG